VQIRIMDREGARGELIKQEKGQPEGTVKGTHAFFRNRTGDCRAFHLAFRVHNDTCIVLTLSQNHPCQQESVCCVTGDGGTRGWTKKTYLKVKEYTISPAPSFTLTDYYCWHG
jgi:hypothetical protein